MTQPIDNGALVATLKEALAAITTALDARPGTEAA
jgi:hypothetical protein